MIPNFRMSVSTNRVTGEILAVYFRFRKGRVSETRAFAGGAAFANYSKNGDLLGIELLGPCKLSVLDKISLDRDSKRFVERSVPREMALA